MMHSSSCCSDQDFINTLYEMPIEELLTLDKTHLQDFLTRAELLCHWLRGILALAKQKEIIVQEL